MIGGFQFHGQHAKLPNNKPPEYDCLVFWRILYVNGLEAFTVTVYDCHIQAQKHLVVDILQRRDKNGRSHELKVARRRVMVNISQPSSFWSVHPFGISIDVDRAQSDSSGSRGAFLPNSKRTNKQATIHSLWRCANTSQTVWPTHSQHYKAPVHYSNYSMNREWSWAIVLI